MKHSTSRALPLLAAFLIGLIDSNAAETARYRELNDFQFLKRWLVLSPLPLKAGEADSPSETAQREAFATDFLASVGTEAGVRPEEGTSVKHGGSDFRWQVLTSTKDEVSFLPAGATNDYCVAYAWAELELAEAKSALLSLGSDDAIKVWVNGKLIHENWAMRALTKGEDLVPCDLLKGTNTLLLKVQNGRGDWGFACRFLEAKDLSELLVTAAWNGNLERAKALLTHGANVNGAWHEVTPWQAAKIAGDREMAEFLAGKGADSTVAMPDPVKVIDEVLSEATRGDSPGMAVLVAKEGKVLFKKGYGLANIENGVRVTPSTRFRIGSVTKQFTAAAILRLQAQGRLHITNTLAQYIPDYPRGGEVTLRHLLTHTSGIHSYTDKPEFERNARLGTTPEELINTFKQDPFDFSPGEKWAYCNSGYFLLGWIVEKVSGQPYAQFLQKEFFEPLGMKNTGVHTASAIIKQEATGYSYENGSYRKAMNWDMSKAGGAGALYSTVDDLYCWNEALFSGKVICQADLQAAFAPVVTKQDTEEPGKKLTGYGYGWAINQARGLKVIGHGGGLHGFLSDLSRYVDQKLTIVTLANVAPPPAHLVPPTVSRQIASLYLWQAMEEKPVALPQAPADLAAFEGRYDYSGPILAVTREGSHLFAQLTGQPRFEIFPKSADTFFWKVVEAEVTFVRNPKGEVVKAIHRQGGATIDAPKIAEQKEVALAEPILEACVGKYDFSQGQAVLAITREGDRLYVQLSGQPKFELFARSETEFFLKAVAAEVGFVKDGSGKIVRATLKQGGRTMEAPRME